MREVPISVEAARVGAAAWQAARGVGRFVTAPTGKPRNARAAREVRNTFAHLGPTYVKLGQLIASSPGVFPETLSDEFRTLLDRVPPANAEAVRQLFVDELGAPPEDVFATFDVDPIASASIAQVHDATLRSGERVVVKIQRPGIRLRLAADMQILRRVAWAIERSAYGRMLSARDVIADFEANLNEELDFRNEARAMEEWFATVRESQFGARVRVPGVQWDHTSARVLTMEHIEADRIDDLPALQAAGHDGAELIKTLLLSLLESALRGGIFHGDLHAGNVWVDHGGRLVYLDFGIVGRFDEPMRALLRRLIGDLLVHNDFAAAGRTLFEMGAVRRPGSADGAATDIAKFTRPLATADLSSLSYASLGKELAGLARVYDARLPRELVLVGKQFLYVERYMKLLAPKWKAIADPDLLAYMVGILDEAEQERAATRD